MLPQRFASGQSIVRKSRTGDGRPSMLPKPRRPGSTDRMSTEVRRPSAAGPRSSSAEPSRATVTGRLSREASATKLPINGRSRSQQGDRYGQSLMTPLRSSQYAARPTITPQRTPSEDRTTRSWQVSLERVLAFVTTKDQRPISNTGWQRAEMARVQEALAARGAGNNMALVRPLTIARFVDIVDSLLNVIASDNKLNSDNYVAKLPILSKRLLYPGAVSKSWLKTVNTLHAFPHALALVAYLLDLVNDVETPLCNVQLYTDKEELACLRREYIDKCWVRFQNPECQFDDLNEEYRQELQELLGNDEDKISELQQLIKKYETCLEDEADQAAAEEEARLVERRDALLVSLRASRAARRETRLAADAHTAAVRDRGEALRALDAEVERALAESQQLKQELEKQEMTVEERGRLLDEVDYSLRVQDSKQVLADQIAKMVLSKESELALWQKKTLDSCVEYKQGLIHLSAELPHLAACAIDEKELMEAECAERAARASATLRECALSLQRRAAECARARNALARKRAALLEETRTMITETRGSVQREQDALYAEASREAAEAAEWSAEWEETRRQMEALHAEQWHYATVEHNLTFWEKQQHAWRSKMDAMCSYLEWKREEAHRSLEAACAQRTQLVLTTVALLNDKLAHC